MNKNNITELSNLVLFPSGYQNCHSYRIPSLLKLSTGRLIAVVDQRVENAMDCPYATINQIIRYSDDNGLNWAEGQVFLKVEQLGKSRVSAIDSVIVEDKKAKTIFLMVDTFPGGSGIIGPSKKMNPIVKSGVGLTPDKKYKKFYQTGSADKFVMKGLPNNNKNHYWFQVYKLKDGDWKNTNDTNLLPTAIYVNNSYDPKTKVLHGAVYENVTDYQNIQTQPVCSIYDGFDNTQANYLKPKYYIDSTSYIYLLKSFDQGQNWELVKNVNDEVTNDTNICAIIMGPGKGLQLKNQKDQKLNGRLILPVYTAMDYEIPGHFYTTFSDDGGQNWKTGNYPNPLGVKNWKWTSEGQMIEDQFGQVWAFLRQEQQNVYCLSKSLDGTATWQTVTNQKYSMDCFKHEPLNTVIMYGLAHFVAKKQDYALVSLPTTFDRKNGYLFVMNLKTPQKLQPIYQFGELGDTFGYSTIEVLEQTDTTLTIGILYEVSVTRNKTLAWIGFDEKENDYSLATEMIYKTLRIDLDWVVKSSD